MRSEGSLIFVVRPRLRDWLGEQPLWCGSLCLPVETNGAGGERYAHGDKAGGFHSHNAMGQALTVKCAYASLSSFMFSLLILETASVPDGSHLAGGFSQAHVSSALPWLMETDLFRYQNSIQYPPSLMFIRSEKRLAFIITGVAL